MTSAQHGTAQRQGRYDIMRAAYRQLPSLAPITEAEDVELPEDIRAALADYQATRQAAGLWA